MTLFCCSELPKQNDNPDKKEFILYPQRWWTLISYSMLSLSSAWLWITWAPLATSLTQLWDVPLSAVNALAGVFNYVYIPGSFISSYLVVNQLGLRRGLIVGGILNATGAWIRYAHYDNYRMVYVGTFVCALAQTFTLSTPALLAGNWFGEKERATATALGILANQLGTAFGLGATVVVDFFDVSVLTESSYVNGLSTATLGYRDIIDESALESYLFFQFIVTCIALQAVALFVEDKPPTPPSLAAAAGSNGSDCDLYQKMNLVEKDCEKCETCNYIQFTPNNNEIAVVGERTKLLNGPSKEISSTRSFQSKVRLNQTSSPTYIQSIYAVLQNITSLAFMLCFGLAVGVYYTIPTFLSQLFSLQSPRTVGYLGAMYQVLGAIGSFFAGRIMDVTQGHRQISLICLFGASCCLVLCYFQLRASTSSHDIIEPSKWMWIGELSTIGLAGICLSAFNTVGIDLGTGMVFPADESAVAGVMQVAAEVGAFLLLTTGGRLASSSFSVSVAEDGGILADGNSTWIAADDPSIGATEASIAQGNLVLLWACSLAAAWIVLVITRTEVIRPSGKPNSSM